MGSVTRAIAVTEIQNYKCAKVYRERKKHFLICVSKLSYDDEKLRKKLACAIFDNKNFDSRSEVTYLTLRENFHENFERKPFGKRSKT